MSFNSLTSTRHLSFSEFQKLEIIDLSNNRLRDIDANINLASNLTDIIVANNDITDIPLNICKLTNIRNLSILGNPQKTIRLQVVQQGTDAIMKVFIHLNPYLCFKNCECRHLNYGYLMEVS